MHGRDIDQIPFRSPDFDAGEHQGLRVYGTEYRMRKQLTEPAPHRGNI
jgi:hypothetical protein